MSLIISTDLSLTAASSTVSSKTVAQLQAFKASDNPGQVIKISNLPEASRSFTWAYSVGTQWKSVYLQTVVSNDPGAAKPVKALGAWNLIHAETVNAPAGQRSFYMPMRMVTASGDADGIVLRFPARILRYDNVGMTEPLGNDMSVSEWALEREGTKFTTPVKVSNARVFNITSAADTNSDLITPQMLGFVDGKIPVGTVLWSKGKGTVPEGGKMPRNLRNLYSQANISGWFYDASSTTVPSVDTLGTLNSTGAAPAEIESPYAPYLLGTFVDPATKAFCFIGDSIGAGQGDDNSFGNTGMGYLNRAVGKFDVPMASMNLSVPGSKSDSGISDPYLLELMAFGPDGLAINWGTNDGADQSPVTPAQAIANIKAQIARYKSAPGIRSGVKAAVAHLLPRTYDPSGKYTTDAAQQIYNNWGSGGFSQTFNGLATTEQFDVVLLQDVVRSSTDPFKWAGPSQLAFDGTHCNGAGYAALATAVAPVLKAAWM